MTITTEEILSRFLFLFLKHLSIELTHFAILTNHQQLPKKSILRKSYNENNSILLTQSFNRPKVFFTHIDSFVFDPQLPCHFLNQLQREQFYVSINDQQVQLKTNYQNKSKIKKKNR